MQFFFRRQRYAHYLFFFIPENQKELPLIWISHTQPPCWRNLTLYSVGFTTAFGMMIREEVAHSDSTNLS